MNSGQPGVSGEPRIWRCAFRVNAGVTYKNVTGMTGKYKKVVSALCWTQPYL
jgi:hypothetical protein